MCHPWHHEVHVRLYDTWQTWPLVVVWVPQCSIIETHVLLSSLKLYRRVIRAYVLICDLGGVNRSDLDITTWLEWKPDLVFPMRWGRVSSIRSRKMLWNWKNRSLVHVQMLTEYRKHQLELPPPGCWQPETAPLQKLPTKTSQPLLLLLYRTNLLRFHAV